MACSCWYWYPLYFIASMTLAVIAISSAVHSSSKTSTPQQFPLLPHTLPINATESLRKSGFTFMSDLLTRSPPFFLIPNNSTFFAIKDSSIKNTSLPLWFLKSLLFYHTTPSNSTMQELLNMPQGSCIQTFFRQKKISLTHVNNSSEKTIQINKVLISNPDLFIGDGIVIHGVVAPFSDIKRQDLQGGTLDFIHSPPCRSTPPNKKNSTTSYDGSYSNSKIFVEWARVVQLLGSKGYSSFSAALHSVLDGILEDLIGIGSATVFAPLDFSLIGCPSSLVDRTVRFHILPRRFSYSELRSLPVRTLLKTMMEEEHLEIDGILGFLKGVVINGVEIVVPDMFTSDRFVVHGIAKPFRMGESAA